MAIIIIFIIIAFFLSILNCSDNVAVNTSSIEIVAIVAAIAVNKKNTTPSIVPPGIFENIKGTVLNNSPGPLPGACPKENTAGNIATPAINETNVSAIATDAPVFTKLLSSVK